MLPAKRLRWIGRCVVSEPYDYSIIKNAPAVNPSATTPVPSNGAFAQITFPYLNKNLDSLDYVLY
jgi:hypothetical protein